MTDTRHTGNERDQLAAEYALGALQGDELVHARALAASDAEFARQVARWSGRLAPMLDEVDPVSPPEQTWSAIDRRLGPASGGGEVVQLRRKVNLWRGFTAAATALAASLALVLVTRPSPAPSPPVETPSPRPAPLVAMLGDESDAALLVANWDPSDRGLMVAVADDMPGDPAHSHELWVIPADGQPRSLGTMPARPHMRMRVAEPLAAELRAGATLAVSVEPVGGSPTGLPTGPVIASGKLEAS